MYSPLVSWSKDVISTLPYLNELTPEYPLRYVAIANPQSKLDELYQAKKKYNFIDLRVKALPLDELYDYLYA